MIYCFAMPKYIRHTVVKWYRIYADWYKPDPADLREW